MKRSVKGGSRGECYRALAETSAQALEAVDCRSEHAEYQVASIHDKELASLCPPGTMPLVYPEPAKTFCLGSP
ncbi:LppU/SCO3897 family protein [Propionibacteriaceae bacterium Y2011]|uniref:LppU/SCO3897 family protein n=1 Tax=Microlunatus sp. Y2014 TaxID=3418488 RepID=UPI003B4D9EF5